VLLHDDQFDLATDPAICHGQPTIARTRVTVSVVLDRLAAGMTTAEIPGDRTTIRPAPRGGA
jgi:uncharacterized protein (DUF433 family)